MAHQIKNPDKTELLKLQLNAAIEIYKNHCELFLKWVALYLAVVGAIAIYIINKELSDVIRRWIPVLIAIGSLLLSIGCFGMWTWLKNLERAMNKVSGELGISPLPLFGANILTLLMLILSAGFCVVGLSLAFWWKSYFPSP
ncbi:MAG TPA: hypothetical protein VF528_14460 [Pyrinomonadaceae bacterium]|jgi:ascorbate-specific PTS system EIIC-type component UlaA